MAFNPDQPRDEKGQWTDGGGDAGRSATAFGIAGMRLDAGQGAALDGYKEYSGRVLRLSGGRYNEKEVLLLRGSKIKITKGPERSKVGKYEVSRYTGIYIPDKRYRA